MPAPSPARHGSGGGAPVRGCLFTLAVAALAAGAVAGCEHLPAPAAGRPAAPLPDGMLASFRPAHPAFDLRLEPLDRGRSFERFRWEAWAYRESTGAMERLNGEYYRTRRPAADGRAPLVVLAPILGGEQTEYLACHLFARFATSVGMSAFFVHQERRVLASDRDGPALDTALRQAVRDQVRALDLFLERPEVDPRALGAVGISLGAIRLVPLIAAEPRLTANVLCMGGADLAGIVRDSREGGVVRYLARRLRREGTSREEVATELRDWLVAEPGALAGSIAPERVLLLLARFDDKVPIRYGLELRSRLGDPETWMLPAGHYTAIALAPVAAQIGFSWLGARFRERRADAHERNPNSPP